MKNKQKWGEDYFLYQTHELSGKAAETRAKESANFLHGSVDKGMILKRCEIEQCRNLHDKPCES